MISTVIGWTTLSTLTAITFGAAVATKAVRSNVSINFMGAPASSVSLPKGNHCLAAARVLSRTAGLWAGEFQIPLATRAKLTDTRAVGQLTARLEVGGMLCAGIRQIMQIKFCRPR